MLSEQSILKHLPKDLSKNQVLIIDGIRYAAEIAEIAYLRLENMVDKVSMQNLEVNMQDIASGLADSWTIIDSAHRFSDLVDNLPGLPNSNWRRLLRNRLEEARDLRNNIQHQLGEIENLINDQGQIWGYLTWAEARNGQHTGNWFSMNPGTTYVGDTWIIAGPMKLPYPVPLRRIRLTAYGHQIYIGRLLMAIQDGIKGLEEDISNNRVPAIGDTAHQISGSDKVIFGGIYLEVEVQNEKEDN